MVRPVAYVCKKTPHSHDPVRLHKRASRDITRQSPSVIGYNVIGKLLVPKYSALNEGIVSNPPPQQSRMSERPRGWTAVAQREQAGPQEADPDVSN
jgi:hypothetical protein